MTYHGCDKHGIVITNDTVVKGNEKISPTISTIHRNFTERLLILNPYQKVALDDIEIGTEKKIPLWLFGFLY